MWYARQLLVLGTCQLAQDLVLTQQVSHSLQTAVALLQERVAPQPTEARVTSQQPVLSAKQLDLPHKEPALGSCCPFSPRLNSVLHTG